MEGTKIITKNLCLVSRDGGGEGGTCDHAGK